MTGGDSFCYLGLGAASENARIIIFSHHGRYPLYDVTYRIVDLEVIRGQPITLDNVFRGTGSLANMAPGLAVTTKALLDLPTSGKLDLNIFFTARNGSRNQMLRMRRTGKEWVSATRVQSNPTGKELYQKVDDGFPRKPDGEIDWDH